MQVQSVILLFLLMMTTLAIVVLGQHCPRTTITSFATKTIYRNAKTPKTAQPANFPGCSPVQVYHIARHGTRNPGASTVKSMIYNVPNLRDAIVAAADERKGRLCKEDVDALRNWKLEINGSSTNILTNEGKSELKEIAKRLEARFPSLFIKPYSESVYRFISTKSDRTEDSAKAFAMGLFGTEKGINFEVDENNQLLRTYKTCSRWEHEVDDNETALADYHNFTQHNQFFDMLDSVSMRLGFDDLLTFYNISLLYEMCRFDTAWNPTRTSSSPWCNLFDDSDLQMLEFSEDLRYYWNDGYGYPLNYEQTCPVLKDIVDNFRGTTENQNASNPENLPPVGLFHFSHSGLLLKFYARLGLFHDKNPLTQDNFQSSAGRQWKTSVIDPFAANIAFVLFKCDGEQYKVATYVQEKEVILPNCTTTLCPLETFLATYGPIADNCNLKDICSYSGSNTVTLSAVLISVLSFIILYRTFTPNNL